ncbi:MAG: tetratricopeptide repeat protein [Burkholderiales bacterium]|nr:tetratricopeptide repeat protein [Burkholderiales bacterium]
MRMAVAAVTMALLASCATTPEAPRDGRYFHDELFAPPAEPIDARDVFALSDDMRRYLEAEIAIRPKDKTRQVALVDALYKHGELKLEYDSASTRNAAQAFAARSGNCLSLVIMTAAFAKALDLPVTYQKVFVDDVWARSGDIYLAVGHVNLTLGRRATDDGGFGYRVGRKPRESEGMTIDFLPPEDMRRVYTRAIDESIVTAMYMNNRAVEALARDRVDDAYWWVREAIVQAPGFLVAYNTLGAVYHKHRSNTQAEAVLRYVLGLEPANTQAMGNLVAVLADSGRAAESRQLAARLEEIEPEPPFAYFNRGMTAIRAGDFRAAKEMFKRELARQPDYHESHYWLAVAHLGLGESGEARKHLAIAMRSSTTRGDHDRYAAKLDRLKER